MSGRRTKLCGDALEHAGLVSLGTLIGVAFELDEVRELVRKHGLSPKGGFRIERAPLKVLAPLLSDLESPAVVEDICRLLERKLRGPKLESTDESHQVESVPIAMLRLKEQELEQVRDDLERGSHQAARLRERESELIRRLEQTEEFEARQHGEIEQLRRELETMANGPAPVDQGPRIHELERDLEILGEVEEGLRRMLAARASRIRELEARVAEAQNNVPKRRRRDAPVVEAPALVDQFRVPHFSTGFYKSLEGKERRSVSQAVQAVLLFCTEGVAYPGLEVKQIEGQDLWSLRASLRLRVYFRVREDGDVDIVALADREEQHTILRRLKDRSQ